MLAAVVVSGHRGPGVLAVVYSQSWIRVCTLYTLYAQIGGYSEAYTSPCVCIVSTRKLLATTDKKPLQNRVTLLDSTLPGAARIITRIALQKACGQQLLLQALSRTV